MTMVDVPKSSQLTGESAVTTPRPPLSGRLLASVALGGVGVLIVVFVVMWFWVNDAPVTGEQKTTAHLEVFKTSASVAVMLGGLGALYLAARRQRTQERELDHAVRVADINRRHTERVAAASEDDAARRRVTELYTKAADQLGSDKAPVRLAGLYALERLAQDNPDQRQTIINLWCAYLRMPYVPPSWTGPSSTTGDQPPGVRRPLLRNPHRRTELRRPEPEVVTPFSPTESAEAVLERDVRTSVQRLLAEHLRPRLDDTDKPHPHYWPEVSEIDLTDATLVNLDFSKCRLPTSVSFKRATFVGSGNFAFTSFTGEPRFDLAHFSTQAYFRNAKFLSGASFDYAKLTGAFFAGAIFSGDYRQ
jgi:hypothetical protein